MGEELTAMFAQHRSPVEPLKVIIATTYLVVYAIVVVTSIVTGLGALFL